MTEKDRLVVDYGKFTQRVFLKGVEHFQEHSSAVEKSHKKSIGALKRFAQQMELEDFDNEIQGL